MYISSLQCYCKKESQEARILRFYLACGGHSIIVAIVSVFSLY